jgi:hypothetical protein
VLAVTSLDIAERVAAGADWLDGQKLLWWDHVNLDALHLDDPCGCILGQLFGSFYAVELSLDDAVRMGFHSVLVDEAQVIEFEALADAWRELIQRRRGLSVVAPV